MKAYSITVLKRLFKYFATRKVNSNQQELPQVPHVFAHTLIIKPRNEFCANFIVVFTLWTFKKFMISILLNCILNIF